MPIDKELTEVLRPLARDSLKVWVPFFANTFPLAFYYGRAAKKPAIRDTWGTWSSFKEDPAKEVHIFYASKGEVESLRTHPIDGVVLLDSCVTRYRPRWFFLEAATEIAKRVRDCRGMFTSDAADVLNWYKGIEIVTDVRPTAQVVETFLTTALASPPTIRYVTATTFDGTLRCQLEGMLRVFFFGAPRTAVLKQQDEIYTSVELPDDRFAAAQLDTHIVVAGNLGQYGGEILRALESFHATLFAAASDIASGARGDSDFRNLWGAYAEIERVEQHRLAFREPRHYAICLSEHHGGGAGPPRQPVASAASPPWHVHVGAGALGLGLVMPCLDHVARLVVLQRDGEKWGVLNLSDAVTLSNSQGWCRQCSCIFVERSESVSNALQRIETAVAKAATLVVTDHREVWRAVLGHATAITYSMKDGQAELGALLASIPFTTAPTLYPFENVVDIGSLPPTLPRAQLVVDRVCAKAVISTKAIHVGCEQNGSVRYLLPGPDTDDFLGRSTQSGVEVHALRSMEEWRFYWRQKRYLMNGVHYVIAALSYDYLRDHRISREYWEGQLVPILTNLILGEEQRYVKLVERFVEFQAVRLAAETDATVLDALFGGSPHEAAWQMCALASEVLERAKGVLDRLGRVLPPDDPTSNLRKCREFLIESLRVMAEKRERIAEIRSPRGGALPDWFYAITAVLEAVLLAQHSTKRGE